VKQSTQYKITVKLPSKNPEVLTLFGYRIKPESPPEVFIACSLDAGAIHTAVLDTRQVTFEFDHVPTMEELEMFEEMEHRVEPWAAELAEQLFQLRDYVHYNFGTLRALTKAENESLRDEIYKLLEKIDPNLISINQYRKGGNYATDTSE
jgi:hypothetical protein